MDEALEVGVLLRQGGDEVVDSVEEVQHHVVAHDWFPGGRETLHYLKKKRNIFFNFESVQPFWIA